MNPRSVIVDEARRLLGLRETSHNRGPGIKVLWEATSYEDGYLNREPWCAAFVAAVVAAAWSKEPLLRVGRRPDFPAVDQWREWALSPDAGCMVFEPKAWFLAMPGDVVIFTFSHIGIVLEARAHGLDTIEGNTNDAGGRDGGCSMVKFRAASLVRMIIRLPVKGERA